MIRAFERAMAYDLWPFLLKGKGTDANIHHVGALWKALIILVWIMGLESKTAPTQFQPAANQCALLHSVTRALGF